MFVSTRPSYHVIKSRAGVGLCPTRVSVVGSLSETRLVKKTADATMGGVDVDGDNLVTIIDLFLVITLWFAFCLSLLLCYAVFDTYDKMQRKRDMDLRNETEVLDPKDEFEKLSNEDSETDESIVSEDQGVTIENFESVYFTNDKDLA